MATFTSKMFTYLGVLVSVKEEGKNEKCLKVNFAFLLLVTNRKMLNDFNEETMFLKLFIFPKFVFLKMPLFGSIGYDGYEDLIGFFAFYLIDPKRDIFIYYSD